MTQTSQQTQAVTQQPQQNSITVFKAYLDNQNVQRRFQNVLGDHKDTFVASLLDVYGGNKDIQLCNPQAVIEEALKAASLQLPVNKALGFAYIVVYKNTVKTPDGRWVKVPTPTFVPGYKGYIQLAMRTGQYRTINADLVYEGELQKADKLSGTISFNGEKKSDKIIGYFCYFELLNGFSKTLYMTVEQMAAYAKRYSPSVKKETTVEQLVAKANDGTVSKSVGWEGNFNDMALKTVIRRLLSKYGYLSVEMQGVMAAENHAEDTALEARQKLSEQSVQQQLNVNAEDATFENVDAETGEVATSSKETSEAESSQQAQESPY